MDALSVYGSCGVDTRCTKAFRACQKLNAWSIHKNARGITYRPHHGRCTSIPLIFNDHRWPTNAYAITAATTLYGPLASRLSLHLPLRSSAHLCALGSGRCVTDAIPFRRSACLVLVRLAVNQWCSAAMSALWNSTTYVATYVDAMACAPFASQRECIA